MKITFLIRSQSKDTEKTVKVYLRLRTPQLNIYANTGRIVQIKHWSTKDEAPRIGAPKYKEITEALATIRAELPALVTDQADPGTITKEWTEKAIDKILNPDKYRVRPLTLYRFMEKFIRDAETTAHHTTGKMVTRAVVNNYKNVFSELKDFSDTHRKGKELNWQDIDLDFYGDYVQYLQNKQLAKNTIGKRIRTLKVFLNAAADQGHQVNPAHRSKRFKANNEPSESIYLNEKELLNLYRHDFTGDKKLDKVRDLFIVMCWTGLRYGDAAKLTAANIEGDFLNVTQAKTGDPVIIPLHWTVKAIFEKHGGELPKPMSNQKFNGYIRTVAQRAGISGQVAKTITRGGMKVTRNYNKWELVTAHTGRRSFATNLYLQDFPSISIMAVTGHKSETAFLKYIKVTPREHAEKLKTFWLNKGHHLRAVK